MVYRIDNRKKKHNGRYTVLGIVFGVILIAGAIGVYDNYKQPTINDIQVVKNRVDLEVDKAKPIESIPIENSVGQPTQSQIIIPKPVNTNELEYSIHNQINQIREQNGIKSLIFSEQIANIAREHSQDMAINNYFDHTSLDGKTLQNRMYDARLPCYPAGENIEENYVSTPDLLNSIMETWMQSSGHRENILSPYYTSEGIGVYVNGDNLLITEDFC